MNIYEKRIIGGIIKGVVRPSEIDLTTSDFETADLAACLAFAAQLESEGKTIDADLLCSRLSEKDYGFYTGDDLRLMSAAVASASIVWESVDKVKSSALKTMILSETAKIALLEDKSSVELLDRIKAIVTKADDHYRTSENNFVFLSELAPKVKAVYDDLHAGVSYSVPTYYPTIDNLILDGFSRGDEHIIVGFTGSGKSALALAFAREQARQGNCVGIVSREMSDIENVMRLQASDAQIPRWQMRKGMRDSTHTDLTGHLETFSELPIAFDTRTTDVDALRPQVKRMVEGYDMKILYVDYLQLLASKGNQGTRAGEVQAISRTLKEIAMENKIPIVSLCQFNRGAAQATIYDILGHLKESSGIEQDASTILYVQLEKTEEKKEVKDAKLTVLKNRNGATFASVELLYRGETFSFTENAPDMSGVYRGGS